MEEKPQKHINLVIGCNSKDNLHTEFYINNKNRMICEHCKEDMTSDLLNIYEQTGKYLKSIK